MPLRLVVCEKEILEKVLEAEGRLEVSLQDWTVGHISDIQFGPQSVGRVRSSGLEGLQ